MVVEQLKNKIMKKGFSTLYIVIILGSVSLGLVLMMTTSNFWAVKSGIIVKKNSQSKALANACAEVVLELMRESNNFVGVGNVTIGTSNCNYNVTNIGGMNRSIYITSTRKFWSEFFVDRSKNYWFPANRSMVQCPSWFQTDAFDPAKTYGMRLGDDLNYYKENLKLTWNSTQYLYVKNLKVIREPTKLYLLADTYYDSTTNQYARLHHDSGFAMHARHNNAANALFFDGHTQQIKYKEAGQMWKEDRSAEAKMNGSATFSGNFRIYLEDPSIYIRYSYTGARL
jgi:prepilin-type processing-associated H-X9-DG protein